MRSKYIVFLAAFLTADISIGEQIDLFILAGQSNAQGWMGDAAYYPADNGAPSDGSARTSDCGANVLAVVRGGSWFYVPQFLRCAFRFR